MKEFVEFRMAETKAQQYLRPTDGVSITSGVRKLILSFNDELVTKVLKIQKELKENGDYLFLYSYVHRRYTESELRDAHALRLIIPHIFEPAGEECGTVYDESCACKYCGAGGIQVSDLILETQILPSQNKIAIAKTIAGEIIVSQKAADLFVASNLIGAVFRPVRQRMKQRLTAPNWYQLIVKTKPLNIAGPTLAGTTIFDDGSEQSICQGEILNQLGNDGSWCDRFGQHRCPLGHTIGLNLNSELTVLREEMEEWDIACTKQMVGVRRGLLRPESLLVISSRFRKLVIQHGLKGMKFEIVHFL